MPITVTNLTVTRTYDANSVSIDVLADVLGTLIEDVEAGTYLGTQWTVTNGTTDRAANALSTTIDEVADLIATFVSDNPLAATAWNFAVSNFTPDTALDCNSTSLTELIHVLATLASQFGGIGQSPIFIRTIGRLNLGVAAKGVLASV